MFAEYKPSYRVIEYDDHLGKNVEVCYPAEYLCDTLVNSHPYNAAYTVRGINQMSLYIANTFNNVYRMELDERIHNVIQKHNKIFNDLLWILPYHVLCHVMRFYMDVYICGNYIMIKQKKDLY
jgi:hypothetical protein